MEQQQEFMINNEKEELVFKFEQLYIDMWKLITMSLVVYKRNQKLFTHQRLEYD